MSVLILLIVMIGKESITNTHIKSMDMYVVVDINDFIGLFLHLNSIWYQCYIHIIVCKGILRNSVLKESDSYDFILTSGCD